MTNIVQPKGLQASRYADGSAWTGATNTYVVLSTDTNQINPGDILTLAAGGDANGIPAVTKFTGTGVPVGVMAGVVVPGLNNPSLVGVTLDLTVQNIPAVKAKAYYVAVIDDPDVIFEVMDDGLTVLTTANLNNNCNVTVTNPTSPAQNSATVLATSTVATTSTLPLKMLGLSQRIGNGFGAYAVWLVRFNQHAFLGGQVGY